MIGQVFIQITNKAPFLYPLISIVKLIFPYYRLLFNQLVQVLETERNRHTISFQQNVTSLYVVQPVRQLQHFDVGL